MIAGRCLKIIELRKSIGNREKSHTTDPSAHIAEYSTDIDGNSRDVPVLFESFKMQRRIVEIPRKW